MSICVVIPTYNRKDMVLRALDSVLNQTLLPDEIIIVDDGSTDGTDKVEWDSRVRYIRIKHSGFPGKVRNIGVRESESRLIAFLDSDDTWHRDKLKIQAEYFRDNPGCNILHTRELWVHGEKIVSQKKRKHRRSGDIFKDSLQGCIIGPSTVLIRKSFFNEFSGFNEGIEVGEDYDLWLRVTNRYRVDYLDRELITKNAGHGDQLSFKYGFIEPFKIDVLENLINKGCFTESNKKLAVDSLKNKYDIVINGCLKRGKSSEYREFIKRKEAFWASLD